MALVLVQQIKRVHRLPCCGRILRLTILHLRVRRVSRRGHLRAIVGLPLRARVALLVARATQLSLHFVEMVHQAPRQVALQYADARERRAREQGRAQGLRVDRRDGVLQAGESSRACRQSANELCSDVLHGFARQRALRPATHELSLPLDLAFARPAQDSTWRKDERGLGAREGLERELQVGVQVLLEVRFDCEYPQLCRPERGLPAVEPVGELQLNARTSVRPAREMHLARRARRARWRRAGDAPRECTADV
ncbi:hypothetical protein T492DRAFT_397668 [Pavlovales sp. CCMP2436]|nr:hypothetical protein T492DRAFT_397668 [Pavlovales sp. CCMP2436]|mmetsp:Transcript_240/g.651  ORF Transcript_240/g.651 Transcript_240/m.651 type:complete len:253 (-) Transcript_240:173-931(-)